MVVAIVGSGIAGLAAGDLLAKAGHEVMLFEKELEFGGRLSSLDFGINQPVMVDHKMPYITAETPEFASFLDDLVAKGSMKVWTDHVGCYNGQELFQRYPSRDDKAHYVSTNGMLTVGQGLSRWLDVNKGEEVIGITYIGENRRKKKAWMINLKSFRVFEADAVIIALPAIRANAVLQLTQDEFAVRKLIKPVKEVSYLPTITFLLNYGTREIPGFKAIECVNSGIKTIVNESSKRDGAKELVLVVQSSPEFYRTHKAASERSMTDAMLRELAGIVGTWAGQPIKTQAIISKYKTPVNTLSVPFLQSEVSSAPLALVGDYFSGSGIEAAYTSGRLLAETWLTAFNSKKAV